MAALRYYAGDDFVRQVLETYQGDGGLVDDDLRHRIRHWRVLREFEGLAYALQHDPDEFEDAIHKLRGLFKHES